MKSLQKFCAALTLTLLLATGAFGEGIIYPGYTPPPPPPPPTSSSAGIIYPGLTASDEELESEETAIDTATKIALSLVQSVFGLF
jgi:hypothetical protein